MSIQAKISSVSQNISSSATVELPADGLVTLTESSNVALNVNPADVAGYSKSGPDLIVQLKSGETIRIANFYAEGQEPSQLFLVEDGKLVAVSLPPSASDGALVANYIPQETPAGFESLTSETEGLSAGALWLIGAGVVGAGAAIAGGGGGGGGSSSDHSGSGGTPRDMKPPAAASNVKISEDGKIITGTAEPGATVGIDTNGDGKPDVTVIVDPDGTFQGGLNPPLTNGETVTVVVTDPSGNTSPPTTVTAPDTTAPAPADNVQVSPDGTTVTGTAEPGANVEIDTDGDGNPDVTVVAKPDGTFEGTLNPPLTNGETVTVVVTDPAGNSSPPTTAIAPDTTAPAPAGNVQVSPDGTTVTGTAEPGASVEIDTDGDGTPDVTVVANPDGTFQGGLNPPLTNGETVTVVVTDPAGNSSTPVTATAPDFPDAPDINPSNGTVLAGTSEPNMTIELKDGSGNPIGQTTADASGNWSYTPATPLPDGVVVVAVAKNAEGQVSPPASTTIDAVAPLAPTVEPSNGQEFSGTGEAGTTVTLTNSGGTVIGDALVDNQGNWSVTPTSPQVDGEVVQVVATDAAGNTSPPATVTVDALAPAQPTVELSNGSSLSGTAEADSTVVLTDGNGNLIAEVPVDGSGNWTYTPSQPIADGTQVTVIARDDAGNESPAATVQIDSSAPLAPVIKPSNGAELSGTAEADAVVTLEDGAGNPIGQTTADGSGNWSFTPGTVLPNGTVVVATATDPTGNTSAPASTTVDSLAPNAPLINASNGVTLSGTAEPGSTLILTGPSGEITQIQVPSTGVWTYTPSPSLTNGTVVTAVAKDAAGNESLPATTTVDTVAPPTPIINASNGSLFSGTGEIGAVIVLTGPGGVALGQTTVNASGNWSFPVSPAQAHGAQVTATARDAAGNSSGPASIVVDAQAPNSPDIQPSNGTTLSGTAEPNAVIKLTDGSGASIGQTAADGSGNWSFTPGTALPDGTVVKATATDAAGNVSLSDSIVVDALAPAAPVLNVSNGATISGTAEPGSTVTLTDQATGTVITEVNVPASGVWTYTPATALPDGTVVEAVATDAAGNTGPSSSTTVDALPPAAPSVTPSNGTSLSGTAEPNSTLIIREADGTPIAEVPVGSSGNWVYTPATPIAHGTEIEVLARDAAGNVSLPADVTIDSVAPAAPVIAPTQGDVVSGTAEPGAIVTVSVNGSVVTQVNADVNGDWSYIPGTALSHGSVVTATASDASGNMSGPTATTVDSVAPPAPVLSPSNGETITGTAEAGSTVIISVGGSEIGSAVVSPAGTWSFTPSPVLGHNTVVTAVAEDAAGNQSGPASVTVDALAPDAPVVNISNGTLVTGTAEANSIIRVTDSDGNLLAQTTADSGGNWSATLVPAQVNGEVISATATDATGNISPPGSATIDTSMPSIPDVDPSNGSLVSGTGDPGNNIYITVDGGAEIGPILVDGAGNWTYTPPSTLADGAVVSVIAENGVGTRSAPATIIVDSVAPDAPVIDPTNGQAITGTAEAGSTVTVIDGLGNPVGSVVVGADGKWTISPVSLPDGTTIKATAADAAGNTSPEATAVVDAVAPTAPVLSPSNGSVVTGQAEAGVKVILTDGSGNPIGTATADGSGNWSYVPSPVLANGTVVNAVAQDAAGNTSPSSSITVDSVAPPVPVIQPTDGTVITGTAEANAKVILTDGSGNPIGTATADGSGNWTYSPSPALANGSIVRAQAQDTTGNTSGFASTVVDSQAPAAPVINPTDGSVVTGTAEAGVKVVLTDGSGNPIAEVTANASGQWTYTPGTPLVNGTVVNAVAQDATGNTSPQATVTVDSVAPDAPVINPSNGHLITGTAEAGAKVVLTDGSGNPIGEVTANASGNWSLSLTPALAHGTVVNAVAKDATGNTSPSASITTDGLAPDAPVVNISTDGSVISGTAEPNSKVVLVVNGDTANPITVTADGSGVYSHTLAQPLVYGSTVSATAQDAAGNVSPSTSVGYFDTSSVTLTVLEAADGWINYVEAGDGIQVKVDLRPTMLAGQQILVKLEAAGGYEVEVLHTLTAAEIAAGSVTVSLMPKDASNPFPQGTANVTAEVTGGSVSTSPDFGIDTIAPPALVGSALTLVGNILTISTEPQTKLMVTAMVGGVQLSDTVYADNNGLASVNLLQDLGVQLRLDQLLNAHVSVVGEDQAGNQTPVAQLNVGELLLGTGTAGDFDVSLSLLNLGLSGSADPGQRVVVELVTPVVTTQISTLADANGDFSANFVEQLLGLGINLSDLLALGNGIGFNVYTKDELGNTDSSYGIDLGLLGLGPITVTVNGTDGDDVMVGEDGGEKFVSGAGNDIILNVGSGDSVDAGAGNDFIQVTSNNFDTIVGGTGFDTLVLGQGISLSSFGSSHRGIEKIDLGSGGAGNNLTLLSSEVLALGNTGNILRITGDSNDKLTIRTATAAGQQVEDGITYNVYNHGSARVWIEEGTIQVNTNLIGG